MHKINVAIDGPAGAGKSTVAKQLAKRLGYRYIDTGAMYRAMALAWMQCGGMIENVEKFVAMQTLAFVPDEQGEGRLFLNGQCVDAEIRSPEVSQQVPLVAAHPIVREHLVAMQRVLAQDGGVVMDGRDIGTAVLPDAAVKLFLTASVKVRAMRRLGEWQNKDASLELEQVMEAIQSRDQIDQTRAISPLVPAVDAIVLDASALTVDEVVDRIMLHVQEVCMKEQMRDV